MGERDDRIEALKRAEGSARSGLGSVERKYENERNAPVTDTDAQIAALTSQRSSLQEQLAKVQGELSELERGRDAERKAALGRDAQESKQQVSPSDQNRADAAVQSDRAKQEVAQQPGTTNQLTPNSPPPQESGSDRELSGGTQQPGGQSRSGSSGSNQGSDRSDDKPQERDKGFPPFEKSDTAPYGFDPKDVSKEPVNFQRVDPNEGNFLWGQAKSPTSDFKPYSQVLQNGQVADLDALAKEIRRNDAAAQQAASTMALDSNAREAFDRAQFEFAAEKMNQKFADHDRQRDQFGSNSLIDSNQSVVDREMELKRWDVTRDLCRGQAARELDDVRAQLRSEVDNEQQRLEANDQSMLALYEKRVAAQADAQQRLTDYDKMLSENRDQQLRGFKASKDQEFTLVVEDRADTLQAQHFPEVHKNGPEQYFPPIPPAQPSGPGGGGAGGAAPQQQGPAGPAM
jgi:hypothetical protein